MTEPRQDRQDWTQEPWPEWVDDLGSHFQFIEDVDYVRARLCVNALAGVQDPEAAVKAAREAIESMIRTLDMKYVIRTGTDDDEKAYKLMVLENGRSALSLLRGER